MLPQDRMRMKGGLRCHLYDRKEIQPFRPLQARNHRLAKFSTCGKAVESALHDRMFVHYGVVSSSKVTLGSSSHGTTVNFFKEAAASSYCSVPGKCMLLTMCTSEHGQQEARGLWLWLPLQQHIIHQVVGLPRQDWDIQSAQDARP